MNWLGFLVKGQGHIFMAEVSSTRPCRRVKLSGQNCIFDGAFVVVVILGSQSVQSCYYVAAKATYSFALWQKGVFFGPSSVKRGRTHIVLGRNM